MTLPVLLPSSPNTSLYTHRLNKWRFTDPATLSSYVMEVGPSQGLDISFRREQAFSLMQAVNSPSLFLPLGNSPTTGEMNGTLLTQDEYEALLSWWASGIIVQITDHLNRVFNVYITDFLPKRQRKANYPWYHTWTIRCNVLSITDPASSSGGGGGFGGGDLILDAGSVSPTVDDSLDGGISSTTGPAIDDFGGVIP